MSGSRRARDERGMVGGFEALPFGFLVFVAGALLLANAWAVVDANLAASTAAREAVRAFVESSPADDGVAIAEAAALATLTGHGKRPERASISWEGAVLVRCQPVTATVSYRVPLLAVPWIGSFGAGVIEARAAHRGVVDPWRGGLAGDGFEAEDCLG